MLGETEGIVRDKPKKRKFLVGKWDTIGLILCASSVILALVTGIGKGRGIISRGIYGLFGVYVYAVLFFVFFVGISLKFSQRYIINKKYIICSVALLVSAFTAIHLSTTAKQLGNMNFGEYLSYGFKSVTAGGAVFSIPSFVLWNIFAGAVGASIVLGASFIVSAAFMANFIVTRHGENKVIRKRKVPLKPTVSEPYKKDFVELSTQVEQKYQELLQKQSRQTINAQKSQLGLDKLPQKTITTAVYDTTIPLSQLEPQQSFIGDDITNMSTQAAQKFTQGMNQQNVSAMQFTSPSLPEPEPIENLLTEYAIEQEPEAYKPAPRTRQTKTPSVPVNQTTLNEVTESKPQKTYKPARYYRPGLDMIETKSTDLTDFQIDAELKKGMIDAKLKEFSVNAKVAGYTVAPAITRFEIVLGIGTRTDKVYGLENDFQVILGTQQIRMENVSGKNAIGIDVPNKSVGKVSIRDILTSKEWQSNKAPLAFAIGKNVNDEVVIGDVARAPHMLVAGATNSGKSVCINTILTSIIYRADPAEVKLLLVDMKLVELNMYNGIPHMLIRDSIGDVQHAINALKWVQEEMRRRYKLLQTSGLKNLEQYHALPAYQSGQLERMPYIIMVIDEAADLIYTGKREVEDAVKQLTALGRASGIHLILATQRPSVDVITAVIKANLPTRIGFKTASRGDSQTIIGESGCEKLVGCGDMLFLDKEGHLQRVQGAFIDDEEARRIMNYLRENNKCEFNYDVEDYILNGPPQQQAAMGFGDGPSQSREEDPLFLPILRWLVRPENTTKQCSISGIQRKWAIGFGRAGKIRDRYVELGYVSDPANGKGCIVLITKEEVDNLYGPE